MRKPIYIYFAAAVQKVVYCPHYGDLELFLPVAVLEFVFSQDVKYRLRDPFPVSHDSIFISVALLGILQQRK